MLQEPYMLQLSHAAGTQNEIKLKISELIGQKNCEEFYTRYLNNMINGERFDALKKWGFNSVRLPMHYNLFTLPTEKEPVPGQDTWLEKGFKLTDNLLSWCRKNKMYLILDLHAAPGGQEMTGRLQILIHLSPDYGRVKQIRKKTVALGRNLQSDIKMKNGSVDMTLSTKPIINLEGNESLKKLFSEITKEIRLVDKKHIIFIEGNQFANDYAGLTPPWDNNMVYSFHKYWNPTHCGRRFKSISI